MPCLLRPNGWQDVLVSHLAAKGFKSTVFGCFWHSWGTSKACNCYRFLRFDSASSGPKAIAHFALMHLRQQKIATYSVSATSVLAVHRLAMPCSHRINMEFQNSDQRCSLCTPCICDCCRMGVKITTCMDMHGSALYLYITGEQAPGTQVAVQGGSKVILGSPCLLLPNLICFVKAAKLGRLKGDPS